MKPAPEQFLHGARGDRVVLLPQAFIDWLYRAARIRDLSASVRGEDPLVDAVLVAIRLAALEHAGSEVGTKSAPTSEPVARSPQPMTTKDVAAQLNITTRAVTRAITDKRLPASKDTEGRWRIARADLAAYTRTD